MHVAHDAPTLPPILGSSGMIWKSACSAVGLVVPAYVVVVKERRILFGAVQGNAPQSFTMAHLFGGSSKKAMDFVSTSSNVMFVK